jgi:hypothetical protein
MPIMKLHELFEIYYRYYTQNKRCLQPCYGLYMKWGSKCSILLVTWYRYVKIMYLFLNNLRHEAHVQVVRSVKDLPPEYSASAISLVLCRSPPRTTRRYSSCSEYDRRSLPYIASISILSVPQRRSHTCLFDLNFFLRWQLMQLIRLLLDNAQFVFRIFGSRQCNSPTCDLRHGCFWNFA